MNENPEESIFSTNPKFPGYAKPLNEREWLVYRNSGAQVGLIIATDTLGVFDVASLVPRWPNTDPDLLESGDFEEALTYCLKHFSPVP
ncbi:hypothetical protein [Arthrobacter sp. TB 26]|uniref:hypothetical protein n=1 Tax=Arthrobacter sp. TB 26 TaxID=494420 RepID=UPI0009FF7D80|nr:hypothetical protein [Arthrobacter sp. TB 26]